MTHKKDWRIPWRCAVLVSLYVLAVPAEASAGIGNRPLSTDEATILDHGEWSVATGWSFVRQPNNQNEWTWATDLEYGLGGLLEASVELPYQIIDQTTASNLDGWGDVALRLEVNPVKEHGRAPAVSLAAQLKTHSANEDRGLGIGKVDYTMTALASKTFGKTSFHVNVGMTVVGDPPGTDQSDSVSYNFAVEHALTEQLMLAAEVYGQTNTDRDAETHPWETLAGLVYQFAEHLAVDLGIGMGLSQASPDLRLASGVTLTF